MERYLFANMDANNICITTKAFDCNLKLTIMAHTSEHPIHPHLQCKGLAKEQGAQSPRPSRKIMKKAYFLNFDRYKIIYYIYKLYFSYIYNIYIHYINQRGCLCCCYYSIGILGIFYAINNKNNKKHYSEIK